MRRWILIGGFMLGAGTVSVAQGEQTLVRGTLYHGDTIPVIELREVVIFSWHNMSRKQEKQLTRLMRNVKKVYPFAKLAGIKLVEYEEVLANAGSEKERRQIMKQVEKEIEVEYGQDLRDLTISQGKILLKLVDRETGNSSYDLVTDLRGELTAVFYQAFARLFTYNLKIKYDPEGEDREIEWIIQMIERGDI